MTSKLLLALFATALLAMAGTRADTISARKSACMSAVLLNLARPMKSLYEKPMLHLVANGSLRICAFARAS